jgi:hypothetical protein
MHSHREQLAPCALIGHTRYLFFLYCLQLGDTLNKHEVPDKPYELERVVSTRIKPETHKALRQVAAQRDCSVAAVFKDALAQYLAQYRECAA